MNERNKYLALNDWFLAPQGKHVARAFASEIQPFSAELSGKSLLQFGACGESPWLESLNYQNKWFVSAIYHSFDKSICASVHALPLERASVDCIVAPLTMEACAEGKNPIDEMDRVLKSMGSIILFGINPWSFWGGSLRWGRLSCFAHASATLSSSLALKHEFMSRGYKLSWLSSFYYIPPIAHEKWIQKLDFLNQMGKMIWPYPAGFYCLIMQKQDVCMTMIEPEHASTFSLIRPSGC